MKAQIATGETYKQNTIQTQKNNKLKKQYN